jgi:membrane protein DedA with SNARE-associated domain
MGRSLKSIKSRTSGGSFILNLLVIIFLGYFLVSCYNIVDFYQGGVGYAIFAVVALVSILIFIIFKWVGKKNS